MIRGFAICIVAFSAVVLSCKPTDSSVRGTRAGGKRTPGPDETVAARGIIHVAEYKGKIEPKDFQPKQSEWKIYEFLKADTFRPGHTYRLRYELLDNNGGKTVVARTNHVDKSPCPEQVFYLDTGKSGNVRIPVCKLAAPVPAMFPSPDSERKAPAPSTIASASGTSQTFSAVHGVKYWDPCPWMVDWFLGSKIDYVAPETKPAASVVARPKREVGDTMTITAVATLEHASATARFTPFMRLPSGDCASGLEVVTDQDRAQRLYLEAAQYLPGQSNASSGQ